MTTAVRDEFTWAAYEAALRTYLGIPSGDDARLERALAVAAIAGDTFLNNPFDGTTDLKTDLTGDVLLAIEDGVFAFVRAYYEATGATAPKPGLTSVKTGDLSEGYAGSAVTRVTPTDLAISAARPSWLPWRVQVWR
jgi:hypothetical protein